MNLLFIRHGQSEADILGVLEGRANYSLTEKGLKQAKSLASYLHDNEKIDIVYASTLLRAKATAQIISEKLGVGIDFKDTLMEWDNGLLAGLSIQEADERFPLPEDGKKPHHEIAGAESLINFRARAEMFLSRLIEDHPGDETIAIVSHGGTINMLIRSLLNLPLKTNIAIACSDTCIHKFRVKEDQVVIEYLNNNEHTNI